MSKPDTYWLMLATRYRSVLIPLIDYDPPGVAEAKALEVVVGPLITAAKAEGRSEGMAMSRRAPVATMRRWGIGWRNILRCLLGSHRREWQGRCSRCGKAIP